MNKRRRSKKRRRDNFFKAFILLFMLITFISIYLNSKLAIDVQIQNAKVNEMMIINIDVKKGTEYIEMDSLNIEIRHKYKNDEKLTTEIKPYAPGRYQIYYYPQVQGEYFVDITAIQGKNKIYKNDIIKVE